MKVVILAGGLGTRISEETSIKPKPMVEIGGMPILWHLMKLYSNYGFNDFIICLGYKGYIIKEFFANYSLHKSDLTIDIQNNKIIVDSNNSEPWKIKLVDTGADTMTGGRIKRIEKLIDGDSFMLTYGDGLSNIDINELVRFHKLNNKMVTVTAVQPSGKFGALNIDENNNVKSFIEKPDGDGSWINGGFFVCNKEIFKFIENGDQTIWEREPLEKISSQGQMVAYKHRGFWKPMDTLRDKIELDEQWKKGDAPWKLWFK